MYGLTRGLMTLIGAGVAGLLIWTATQIGDETNGAFWAVYGLIAAAGLVMALSQLLGGWTKWGWPRLSANVFLFGFIPVLIAAGWVLLASQPQTNWFQGHVTNWSGDIQIGGLVSDLTEYVGVLAFGIGLVFGFTLDTTGPRRLVAPPTERRAAVTGEQVPEDEPVMAERDAVTTTMTRNRDAVAAGTARGFFGRRAGDGTTITRRRR